MTPTTPLGLWAGEAVRLAPRYGAAALAVALAFAIRALLQPWLAASHAFAAFYPAVFMTAYVLGRGPGAFAVGLSGAGGLWAFVAPAYGFGWGVDGLAMLALFLVTAGVGVWLISTLAAALDSLAREQGRVRAVADAHAELFKDLQSRIGHHMQLVSGLLLLQAHREPDLAVSGLLQEASERSRLIARVHRSFSGDPGAEVDFADFAAALARAVCRETAQPEHAITVEGHGVRLPQETATSLGVALVEGLQFVLRRRPAALLRVAVSRDATGVRLTLGQKGATAADDLTLLPGLELFRTLMTQLGAEVRPAGLGAATMEVRLPVQALAPPARPAVEGATLH